MQPAGTLVLADGASAVLPRGAGFTWRCAAPATLIYVRYKQGAPSDGTLVPIDEQRPWSPRARRWRNC